MKKKYVLSIAGVVICALAIAITVFTNRNNTGFENVNLAPTPQVPIIKIKSPGVFVNNSIANDGQSLNTADSVKTDATGIAEIDFSSGSVTRIAQNSQITLGAASVKIDAGKVWSRVAKVFGKENFQTESENLIASVRGTSYGHEVTKYGHDIVIVAKSTVECDCKIKRPWQAMVDAGFGADYDCTKNTKPNIFRLMSSQLSDPWYLYNKDEDAKLDDAWSTIIPTSKPTPKPSPSVTPSPSASPTATASPTPVPLTIGAISVYCYPTSQLGTACGDRHTKFNIPGGGFDTSANSNITIYAIDASGKQITADAPSTGETIVTPILIVAHFSALPPLYGTYSIQVVQNGQTATSPNSVLVQ